jgi:hypothetical protein
MGSLSVPATSRITPVATCAHQGLIENVVTKHGKRELIAAPISDGSRFEGLLM